MDALCLPIKQCHSNLQRLSVDSFWPFGFGMVRGNGQLASLQHNNNLLIANKEIARKLL
ncbi:Hypothetical predicted protein, partial [Prunus dulcis]